MTEAEIMRCFDVTRKTEGSNKGSQLALRGCTTGHPARARLTPSHIGAQTAHVKKKTHTRNTGRRALVSSFSDPTDMQRRKNTHSHQSLRQNVYM